MNGLATPVSLMITVITGVVVSERRAAMSKQVHYRLISRTPAKCLNDR